MLDLARSYWKTLAALALLGNESWTNGCYFLADDTGLYSSQAPFELTYLYWPSLKDVCFLTPPLPPVIGVLGLLRCDKPMVFPDSRSDAISGGS